MSVPEKVDLGCGNQKLDGFYGVDIVDTEDTDLIQDLDESEWDLPSNHFKTIRAIDVFEHLDNPTKFMEEVWRIAKPDADVVIRGPHFSSGNWHDPTHKRLLGSRTFEHYSSETRFDFYTGCAFQVIEVEIQFQWQPTPLKQFGYVVANHFTTPYEQTFLRNLLPATNIEFHLSPEK